jgi:hypothetical protein
MIAEPRPSLKVTWWRERKVYQLLLNGSKVLAVYVLNTKF